ncbi:MAG: hypothetical protein FJ117_18800 [Deltaproteobacteria bacterium]|nr:hypothetical protein [Deltaproteobacteria bacterium]
MQISRRNLSNLLMASIALMAIIEWSISPAMAQTEKIPRGGTLKMIYAEPPQLNPVLGGGPGS